ncbi:iron complex transport system ATP-binding protein [Prevotella sp. tc2-28]|uniref:ABC transporter ATP-binding protein n=1 Tax=Prevotella sp. tc2-28 TaxID=1761888 RepID=UPI0008990A11|nr:ABC transporter ATP-binding protein [Prevotella sp. tc2-28]SEA65083.1 iron complex transport system ATP-binding protein [Prevotella sp. tc2-28]
MKSVVLQNLSIGYLTKGNEKVVASGLNATINNGELTCLLGRNGIGKSTLLRTLSAFQPALEGEIVISSTQPPSSITSLTDKQLSRLIGIVLTEKPDVQNMTIEELVGMGRSPYTGFWGTLDDEDKKIVGEAIQLVGIENLQGRMVYTLSDGERQKVMIAKALAQQTPIIYLDEPTAFLDFPSKVETMQLLRRLALEEQKTIFLSTHDVELSLQLADKIWLMEPGHLSVGTPRQLADEGALSRFIDHDGITFDKESLTIHITK